MAKQSKKTTDAVKILHNRYIKGDPNRLASIQAEREAANIAGQIYDLRSQAGLTQKQLADLVGTTQSAICRLEDADYGRYTLTMLNKIAAALGSHVEVRMVADQKARAFV